MAIPRRRRRPRPRAPEPLGYAQDFAFPYGQRHILVLVVWLIAVAAGIALADGSIVTLALPELLNELHTSVEGVAAVLGVYCAVVAIALPVLVRVRERWGVRRVGIAGLLLFALASAGSAASGSLAALLVTRAAQGLGAAALLLLAFDRLAGDGSRHHSRRWLWTAAAVIGTAAGPALGGLLTQAFSWRAIFIAQVPVALAAAFVFLRERPVPAPRTAAPPPVEVDPGATGRDERVATVALALTSGALSALLFLLVLLLVTGWGFSPLHAALVLLLVPAGAAAVGRVRGPAVVRAATGCALLGAGVLTLAFIPTPSGWWLVAPLLMGGCGMGLALPALGGELLEERTPRQAGRLLSLRHAGIALTLLALAPLIAWQLNVATNRGKLQGVAALLDSSLSPAKKLSLAPVVAKDVDSADPRAALAGTAAAQRPSLSSSDRAAVDKLVHQGDAIIVEVASDSLRAAFVVAGALGLLAALLLIPPRRRLRFAGSLATASLLLPLAYAIAQQETPSATPALSSPCRAPPTPTAGGLSGLLQNLTYDGLNRLACSEGISREQLVLNLVGS